MEMKLSEMPPMKLPELTGGRRDFSTEEIVQIASQLSDGESVNCCVQLMPVMILMGTLYNRNSMSVATNLQIRNRKHMRSILMYMTNRSHVQHACIGGRSFVDPPSLSLQDVVNIFELGDSVVWHICGGSISNDPNVTHGGW